MFAPMYVQFFKSLYVNYEVKNDYRMHGTHAETVFNSDLRWKNRMRKKGVVDIEFADPSAQSATQ